MKGLIAAGAALAAALIAAAARGTIPKASDDGGVLAVTVIDAVAKVVKTDLVLRTVTIKELGGATVTLNAPPDIALQRFRKGAIVDVRYVEAEALTIRKGDAPADVEVRNVTTAPQGGAPGGIAAKPKRVAGRIAAIDRAARALTIVGPDDAPVVLNVAREVEGFDGLTIGDAAVIEYTEATALSVAKHGDGG